MNYVLFDDRLRQTLLPLTYTRPVCDCRVGIMTIREKWETILKTKTSTLTESYLSKKYKMQLAEEIILINGAICPDENLLKAIENLTIGENLISGKEKYNQVVAIHTTKEKFANISYKDFLSNLNELLNSTNNTTIVNYNNDYVAITSLASIFVLTETEIEKDYDILTRCRKSQTISPTNKVFGDKIFIEQGAKIECSILNSTTGPIYIGKNCEVMENSVIRGPFAMQDGSIIKVGAKIYGGTTIGPHCKVGGEVENVVFFGYANKAHDGFFGNSVLGEWCNIGADSNTSNLKNTYDEVKLWSIEHVKFEETGTIFCGTIMGDHSKCGINTMFNTGTVIGVSSNVFGEGYQRNYIPSFAWGANSGRRIYDINKAIRVAEIVEKRRNVILTEEDKEILLHIYELTTNNEKTKTGEN